MFKKKFNLKNIFGDNHNRTWSYIIVIAVYLIVEASMMSGSITNTMKALLIPTCAYIVAALALNLIVGFLGDLCLGQAGFMAVGAFSGAVASVYFGRFIDNGIIILILSMIVGGLFAALFGVIVGVPVLKLQGDYLAIVTLAFCQIVKTLLLNVYAGVDANGIHFSFIEDKTNMLPDGVMVIKGALGASVKNKVSTFTVGIILILVTLFIIYNLMESKSGRAIMAFRDNKIAAVSVGVNTTKYKLMAFVLSAFITGMAGTLYGLSFSSFKAVKFDFNLSILILVYVVLGGLGNLTGTIISTTVLIILPEALRTFNDYRMIIYAIVLIAVMLITNNPTIMLYINKFTDKVKSLFKAKEKTNV